MANYCKTSMQLMHSSTNQRLTKRKHFNSLRDVIDFIAEEFQLNLDERIELRHLNCLFNRNNYFKIERTGKGFLLEYFDIQAHSLLFSLSSKIIANARIKMMQTIEKFLTYDSVEICYANIDSIHISLKRSDVESFLQSNKELINDNLGGLKIQATADKGYWFDVGRYWLKENGKVVLFKNRTFNHRGAKEQFLSKRRVYSITKTQAFTYIEKRIYSLKHNFSYSKRVSLASEHSVNFERFSYDEIRTSDAANITESTEILKSKQLKIDLFDRISKAY